MTNRKRVTTVIASTLAALVSRLLETGSFIFVDLGGFAEFPEPQMTSICAAAIIRDSSHTGFTGR